ncbi:MAG: ribosome small subunit-dependent GTPase A [Alistipes sp.]|jgi:ribosome biogenesis GTPase|nr:ribosome small subunit-dependent GTPase A [Alistipes sp.]MBQ5855034.1 ribosome small subunit-dependent GTPase A [Alistipes sp.]
MINEGVVVRATGSWYEVLCDGQRINCRIRGKLRLKGVRSTNPVVVGDIVKCESDANGEWVICDILPRRNYIIRRASNLSKESHIIAANIDRAMIVVTLIEPVTALEFIDRFLITCEAYKVPATILLAKIDLLADAPEAVEAFHQTYQSAGYEVIDISATEGIGLERVKELLEGNVTLISGNSGVGKSTLVGKIDPTLDIRTGEISESFHKGKHTTTFSTMYPIGNNGFIIDTPGIKGFGLIEIDDKELWHYFPEMIATAGECRFYNCTHTHEPGCAVTEAVKEGKIAFSRYESYLKILDDDDKYRK